MASMLSFVLSFQCYTLKNKAWNKVFFPCTLVMLPTHRAEHCGFYSRYQSLMIEASDNIAPAELKWRCSAGGHKQEFLHIHAPAGTVSVIMRTKQLKEIHSLIVIFVCFLLPFHHGSSAANFIKKKSFIYIGMRLVCISL